MFSEYNTIIKDLRNIDIKFGLVYPNIYSVGMSSYSLRFIYSYLNSYENIACERIFLPSKVKYPASEDYQSIDITRSIENRLVPKDFDILGFSIQFENDFKNILWILDKANIPLSNKERYSITKDRDIYYPLIIGGGPVATSNPFPLASIFDLFFIGDAEPNLKSFLEYFMKYKFNNLEIDDLFEYLTTVKGLYIPSLKNHTNRITINNLDESPIPIYQLMTKSENRDISFQDTFFIEVNRGCPYKCKFCISSFHNQPFRNRSYQNIKKTLDKVFQELEIEKVSLIGSCISGHPKFLEICEYILKNGKELSIPSIRIDHITPKIINILEKGNIKTITIAPETGSEELRFDLGKRISNKMLINILNEIRNSKIKNVKMYFLIGLPNENDIHIEDTIGLIKKLDNLGFKKDSIKININPLIPKLNTPYEKKVDFYFEKNLKILKDRFEEVKDELKSLFSVKIKFQNIDNLVKNARLQTILSLGDERIGNLLINYYKNGSNFGALRRAENNMNFTINDYLLEIKNCYSPWNYLD